VLRGRGLPDVRGHRGLGLGRGRIVTNLDQTHAGALLCYSLANGAGSPVATVGNIHVRLMTVLGSATANGTELPTGGGYIQGTGITPVTFVAVSGSPAGTSNSALLTVVNMPAATIVGIELWDSAPARKWQGPLTAPKTVNLGDSLTFAINAIAIALG
jgi:hypothetical protein